jgi:hypothetical protein
MRPGQDRIRYHRDLARNQTKLAAFARTKHQAMRQQAHSFVESVSRRMKNFQRNQQKLQSATASDQETLVLRSGHAAHIWGDRIATTVMTRAHEIKHGYLASESPYHTDQPCQRRGARNPARITSQSARQRPKKIPARAAYVDWIILSGRFSVAAAIMSTSRQPEPWLAGYDLKSPN